MNCLIENKAVEQEHVLPGLLRGLVEEEADLLIITEDGESIFTSKILFSIFSKTLRDVFLDSRTSDMTRISLPMSSASVRNLIKLLVEGFVISDRQSLYI